MIYDFRILARYQNIRKHELSPIDEVRYRLCVIID